MTLMGSGGSLYAHYLYLITLQLLQQKNSLCKASTSSSWTMHFTYWDIIDFTKDSTRLILCCCRVYCPFSQIPNIIDKKFPTALWKSPITKITNKVKMYLVYRLRDISLAFGWVGPPSLYFATPLTFNDSGGGFPFNDLRKLCTEVKGWLRYTVAKKYCRKLQPRSWTRRTNITDDRQMTDGFATANTRM